MEIALDPQSSTRITTHTKKVAIAPEKGEVVTLVLGINRVEVAFVDGNWTISHGPNVQTKELLGADEKAFVPSGVSLESIND